MCGHEAVGRHRRSPCAEDHMSGIPTGPATVTPPSLAIRAAPSTLPLSTLCLLPLPQAASLCDLPEVISHLSPHSSNLARLPALATLVLCGPIAAE